MSMYFTAFQELHMYLLQLVQALKYENFDDMKAAYEKESAPITMTVSRKESVDSDVERDRYRIHISQNLEIIYELTI